ncbi:MAG: hypothetical protein ACNYWU_04515 [Desulfobacterales bacterium]
MVTIRAIIRIRRSILFVIYPNLIRMAFGLTLNIYFSRYNTLEETITALIEKSEAGYTIRELNKIVRTEVKNVLPRLCLQKRLNRYYLGRYVTYLSNDQQRESKQKRCRKEQIEKSQGLSSIERHRKKLLPQRLDEITVIKVLVQLIEFPKATNASISQTLQRQGVSIRAKEVQSIIEFYSLQKKMAH